LEYIKDNENDINVDLIIKKRKEYQDTSKIDQCQKELAEYTSKIKDPPEWYDKFDDQETKNNIDKLRKDLEQYPEMDDNEDLSLEELEQQWDDLLEEKTKLEKKVIKYEENPDDLIETIDRLEKKRKQMIEEQDLSQPSFGEEKDLYYHQGLLDAYLDVSKTYNDYFSKIEKIKKKLVSWEKREEWEKVKKIDQELKNLTNKLQTINSQIPLAMKLKTVCRNIEILEKKKNKLTKIKKNKELIEVIKMKLDLLQNKLKEFKDWTVQIETNKNNQKVIKELKEKINSFYEEKKKWDDSYKQYKNDGFVSSRKVMVHYYQKLNYIKVCEMNDQRREVLADYKEQQIDAIKSKERIDAELEHLTKQLNDSMEDYGKLERLNEKANIYKHYVDMMNPNGLPYEILKMYVPQIEREVNEILEIIASFRIQIIMDSSLSEKEKKDNHIKIAAGAINVNIIHHNSLPINVQGGSSFQKFMINLAIRVVVSRISLMSKPNMIAIDEGWGSLDQDNIHNVGKVIDYLRQRFDHILIIDQRPELFNFCDNIINIAINKGTSYLNWTKEEKVFVKKKSVKLMH
jgi:DNA repair exonuclease SbcCD ATPase subunit